MCWIKNGRPLRTKTGSDHAHFCCFTYCPSSGSTRYPHSDFYKLNKWVPIFCVFLSFWYKTMRIYISFENFKLFPYLGFTRETLPSFSSPMYFVSLSGFISLDCGLPPNQSPYIEPTTKLNFSSDADLIKSGKRGRIADEWAYVYKQYNALRYFPEGVRHCYNLSVKQGINYLIRAGFAYGNYDGLNIFPRFDIYLGPNLWRSVYVEYEQNFDIIHMAKSSTLQICLVKTGTTTPFISTLELRPLRNDSYSTQSGSLRLVLRQFYKISGSIVVRYVKSHRFSYMPKN